MDSILDLSRCFSSTIGRAVNAESMSKASQLHGSPHAFTQSIHRVGKGHVFYFDIITHVLLIRASRALHVWRALLRDDGTEPR
jgi:hypothetical protein